MGSRKKRKSAAPAEEQPAKRPSSQQGRRSCAGAPSSGGAGSPLAWSGVGVTVTLPASQALILLGRANLTVLSGELAAAGAVLTPASGSVEVSGDERCSGALLVEPGAATGTVPLAASGATVFSLTRAAGASCAAARPPATPLPAQQQQQQDAAAEADGAQRQRQRQLGFEVWLASAPGAPPVPPPLPPLWQQAAAEVEETLAAAAAAQQQQPAVIVVCGAKKVGKSTFARFLVNSLLSRHSAVAYLDTDCGQPEFTAPGLVSLTVVAAPVLGPPHMHQRRPAAAFFVGDTSPANDPIRYLQYVRELYCWYCQHAAAAAAAAVPAGGLQGGQQQAAPQLQLPPLVVNTLGWVKGMGFDILTELLQGLPVSHLVQISAANPKKNLPAGSFWMASTDRQPPQQQPEPLHWLLPGLGGDQAAQPAASETSARSTAMAPAASEGGSGGGGGGGRLHAVERRALQWEALAQQCIDCCGPAEAVPAGGSKGGSAAAAAAGQAGGDLADRLATAVPYEVGADDLEVQVLHSAVPASQLYRALNGAVVGLCTAQPPPPQQEQQQESAQVGQEPAALPCLGLGIVRATDAVRRRLYVLTAVPAAELESVTVLQLGRLELPASLLQTGAHMAPYLALFSLSSTGTGAGAIKSRNNLLRLSQL